MTDHRQVPAGQTAFLLSQLGGSAAMAFAERVATLGLTPAQAGLIRAVATEPGRSQQALAGQLGLLPSRLVVLVDELEREGILERRRDPADRRHHAIYLTDKGSGSLREIGRLAQAHGEDFLTSLTKPERATLTGLLTKLAEHHALSAGVHPGYRSLGRRS